MSQPQGDDRSINPGLKQFHGGGMPEDVRRHALLRQRGTPLGRRFRILRYQMLHRIRTQRCSARVRKQDFRIVTALLLYPHSEHLHRGPGQGSAALFASLPMTPHVSASTQFDAVLAKTGYFGEPQASLNGKLQQGVVSATQPCRLVGR